MKIILFTLIAFLIISCGPEMTGPTEINKLRVLSVKADKPEAYPGNTINVESLIVAPTDYTKEYHKVWMVCDPQEDGQSQSGLQACMSMNMDLFIGLPVIDSDVFTFTIPVDSLSAFDFESKILYVVLILCEDTMENCMPSGGNTNFDMDKYKITLKRVKVVKEDITVLNTNPEFDKIYLNDVEVTGDTITLPANTKASKNIFKASVKTSSFEQKENPEGKMVDERITFSWTSTEGEFEYFFTDQLKEEVLKDFDENGFKTPKEGGEYKLYVYVNDDRGGANFKVFNVTSQNK